MLSKKVSRYLLSVILSFAALFGAGCDAGAQQAIAPSPVQTSIQATTTQQASPVAKKHQSSQTPVKKAKPTPQPASTPSPAYAPNGTYQNVYGNKVPSPYAAPSVPSGASAQCYDGTYSFSQSRRGTCSHHGGVMTWY